MVGGAYQQPHYAQMNPVNPMQQYQPMSPPPTSYQEEDCGCGAHQHHSPPIHPYNMGQQQMPGGMMHPMQGTQQQMPGGMMSPNARE